MAERIRFEKVLYEKVLDSTNVYAEKLAESGHREHLVIHTDYQTRGSGYDHNSWESEDGKNCLFSMLISEPDIEAGNQFLLSKIICLAVYKALKAYLPAEEVFIKWPNDVYVGKRKIAGILIKHRVRASFIDYSIVGIGINVNQEEFHSSAPNPISIKMLTGKDSDRRKLMEDVLLEAGSMLSEIQQEEALIHERFHGLLFGLGKLHRYEVDGHIREGRVEGVDEYGRLKIRFDQELFFADFKQVKLLLD